MRLAHLIICHKNAEQVKRLVSQLQHPQADIYIHVDKKVSIIPFLPIGALQNVYFVHKREKVYWGGYSIVKATLNGFNQILKSGKKYDYINLMSGQTYPLKSADEIHEFLSGNPGNIYMNILPGWDKGATQDIRLLQYYFAAVKIRGKYTVERIFRAVKPRRFPPGFEPVGRSQWFTIPAACAAYTVRFLEHNKKIARLFKYMWAPDELVFQSILYNSHYRDAITNDNMRYVDWSERQPSPKILTMADAEKIIHSGKFYARKFDTTIDSDILDLIDKRLLSPVTI